MAKKPNPTKRPPTEAEQAARDYLAKNREFVSAGVAANTNGSDANWENYESAGNANFAAVAAKNKAYGVDKGSEVMVDEKGNAVGVAGNSNGFADAVRSLSNLADPLLSAPGTEARADLNNMSSAQFQGKYGDDVFKGTASRNVNPDRVGIDGKKGVPLSPEEKTVTPNALAATAQTERVSAVENAGMLAAQKYLDQRKTFEVGQQERSAAFWADKRPDSGMGVKVVDEKGDRIRSTQQFAAERDERENIDRMAQQNLNVARQANSAAKRQMRNIARAQRNGDVLPAAVTQAAVEQLQSTNLGLGNTNNVDARMSNFRSTIRGQLMNPAEPPKTGIPKTFPRGSALPQRASVDLRPEENPFQKYYDAVMNRGTGGLFGNPLFSR